MSDQPCPHCGHDRVAVEMVIKDEFEENEALKTKVATLEARCAGLERERDALRESRNVLRAVAEKTEEMRMEVVSDGNELQAKLEEEQNAIRTEREERSKLFLSLKEDAEKKTAKILELQTKLAAAEARADALHVSLVKARPCGVCGGSKQITSRRSQEVETCPGCNGYGFDIAILAGHAPATPQQEGE